MNIIAYWSLALCSINPLHFAHAANDTWRASWQKCRGYTVAALSMSPVIRLPCFRDVTWQIGHIKNIREQTQANASTSSNKSSKTQWQRKTGMCKTEMFCCTTCRYIIEHYEPWRVLNSHLFNTGMGGHSSVLRPVLFSLKYHNSSPAGRQRWLFRSPCIKFMYMQMA